MKMIFRKIGRFIKNTPRVIKNLIFLARYPFMWATNRWTGKKIFPTFTEYDSIPKGWRKAFGKQLLKDIKKALKEDKKEFGKKTQIHWLQIKEKYGALVMYATSSERVDKVFSYYEDLSLCYCINCGKPVRYSTSGYILFLCEQCFNEHMQRMKRNDEEYKEQCRLTENDIPKRFVFKNNEMILEEPIIDYYKLWDIEK